MYRYPLFALMLILCLAFLSAPEPTEPLPGDGFKKFQKKLEKCIAERDTATLESLLYDRILENWDSFDCAGEAGCEKEDFIEVFFKQMDHGHWEKMVMILGEGFYSEVDTFQYKHIHHKREDKVYIAPAYLQEVSDTNSTIMIMHDSVKVMRKASPEAELLTIIDRGVVKYIEDEYEYPLTIEGEDGDYWIGIIINGEEGYVKESYTSDIIRRQLKIAKIEGEWKIVEYLCLGPFI